MYVQFPLHRPSKERSRESCHANQVINRQSIRRAALRSVASAARAAAPKAPTSQFAGQFAAKNAVVPSAVSFARYFSQSVRRMNEDENNNVESQIAEQAQGRHILYSI